MMKIKKLYNLVKRKSVSFEIDYRPFYEIVCNETHYTGGGKAIIKIELPYNDFLIFYLKFDDDYKIVKDDDYNFFVKKIKSLPDISIKNVLPF